jgi:iduronate 2-sulfatase
VKPGDRTEINARIGGVFVVESRDGTIHEIHSPSLLGRTINIERP